LDQIKHETHIIFDPSRVLGQMSRQKNHFLMANLENHVFHQNLDVFFSKFFDTHVGNTFLVDDMLYKFMNLIIHVMPSFWNHLIVFVLMEITCFPLCFLI
jgi:hypothetical protein